MSYVNLSGTSIRRATARGVQLDGIAARRNTERLLGKMPDTVPGMSASAVLCVRQVSVHVRSKPRYSQPGSNVLGDESRLLSDKMESLARQAARPALGPVPAHAEAVLFADRAEVLSCLARDHVRHLLAHGWWWRVLLPGENLAAAVAQLWVREAAHAPAALARLAQTNDVVAFVRTFKDSEAAAIAQAMVRVHGLTLLADDRLFDAQSGDELLLFTPAELEKDEAQPLSRELQSKIQAALPEVLVHGLSVSQRQLLALGLSVVRMPGLVRSAAYAQVLPVLLARVNAQTSVVDRREDSNFRGTIHKSHPLSSALSLAGERVDVPSPAGGRGLGRGSLETASQDKFPQKDSNIIDYERPVQSPAEFSSPVEEYKSRISSPKDEGNSNISIPAEQQRTIVPSPASGRGRGQADSFDSNTPDTVAATTLPTDISSLQGLTPQSVMTETLERNDAVAQCQTQVVETQYGGVFFLSNAVLALELYADFTRPLDRGLELSFWDFLALAVVDLGGSEVRKDPLWLLLAELAGRKPGQRPGADFVPPKEWRLPLDWLLPFAGDTAEWTWEADIKRLVVRHTAGFVVLDLLRNEMPVERQLTVELAHYEVSNFKKSTRKLRSPATPLARWRSWVMPYLGHRVAKAMAETLWRRACRQLLNLHGRIECDSERLHVYFSLEQLPVRVRIAGLDRDPGWIPAAGRDLRFYFGCEHG